MKLAPVAVAGMPTTPAPHSASPAAATPNPVSTQRGMLHEVRKGEAFPASAAGNPASEFSRRYAHTLLTMPGAYSVGWGYPENEVWLWMQDEAGAARLKGLIEEQVGQIKLIVGIHSTRQAYDGPGDDNASERARVLAALPGVWDYQHRGNSVWGQILLKTINQSVVDELDPLIKDMYQWGTTPKGQPRMMRVLWKPGVPA